ncbi:hypothetical protein [Halorussus ruber]|uniref:hypothetical protein n=1 Tax=Halorussus ruber TaxID=1126238 RepID=UPI001092F9EB|nr:hypothetical protein [Halorussus ruber]
MKLHTALLVGLVLLAGCSGGLGQTDTPRSTDATAEPTTTEESGAESAPPRLSQPISVVDERSVSYRVEFYVFREPSPVLNVSFGNGTAVTKSVDESDALVQSVPFVDRDDSTVEPVRNITAIAPAVPTGAAEWSAVVRPESAVSLPAPVETGNVTLLVVVERAPADRPWVYSGDAPVRISS